MRIYDWAYIAGLFDGEGSVTASICQRKTATKGGKAGAWVMNLSLRIANNDPTVLRWLEKEIGGTVRFHSPTRDSYVWIVQGDEARAIAMKLLKFSKMKQRQLRLLIKLLDTRTGNGYIATDEVWRERERLISKLRADRYRRRKGESVERLITT